MPDMEFVSSRQENQTFFMSMALAFYVFTSPSMKISDAVEETLTNRQSPCKTSLCFHHMNL